MKIPREVRQKGSVKLANRGTLSRRKEKKLWKSIRTRSIFDPIMLPKFDLKPITYINIQGLACVALLAAMSHPFRCKLYLLRTTLWQKEEDCKGKEQITLNNSLSYIIKTNYLLQLPSTASKIQAEN